MTSGVTTIVVSGVARAVSTAATTGLTGVGTTGIPAMPYRPVSLLAAAGSAPGGISWVGVLPRGPVAGWAFLGLGLGMLAGAGCRVLLRRLRRGTTVGPPWLELAVGVPWAAVVGAVGAGMLPWSWAPLLLGAGWLAVAAGVVDLRHHRLPDALTLPALPAALLLAAPLGLVAVGRAAAGATLLAAAYLLVHAVSPGSLGLGDVKLAAPVGALLAAASWPALLLGCALTAITSAAMAGFVLARSGRRRRAGAGARSGGAGTTPPDAVTSRSGGWWGTACRRTVGERTGPRGGRSVVPAAELPLGPPMLGSAWLVVFLAAVSGAASGAGPMCGVPLGGG